MIYVASPYSSNLPELVSIRYKQVCNFIDYLISENIHAFSPIVYCYKIAPRISKQSDAATWMAFNMDMLRRADGLYLLQLAGWEQSQGVRIELNVCKMLGIPVENYGPDFRRIN